MPGAVGPVVWVNVDVEEAGFKGDTKFPNRQFRQVKSVDASSHRCTLHEGKWTGQVPLPYLWVQSLVDIVRLIRVSAARWPPRNVIDGYKVNDDRKYDVIKPIRATNGDCIDDHVEGNAIAVERDITNIRPVLEN